MKPSTVLESFPEKGAAILCFFHDKEEDEVVGEGYIGLVIATGNKEFQVRFRNGAIEKFTMLEGKNDYYSHFAIIGYISYQEYYKYDKNYYKYKKIIKKINPETEPCKKCIAEFKQQKEQIKNIKKEEKLKIKSGYKPLTDIEEIGEGKKIKFILVQLLDSPRVITAFSRKGEDNDIYINLNKNLKKTKDEDKYISVNKNLILECG